MKISVHAKERMEERSDEMHKITERHIEFIKALSKPVEGRNGNYIYETIGKGIVYDPEKDQCVTFYRV